MILAGVVCVIRIEKRGYGFWRNLRKAKRIWILDEELIQ